MIERPADADPFIRLCNGRIPIIVGVTGTAKLAANLDGLAAVVREECLALKAKYSNSPFVILSSLGEASERYIVREAAKVLKAGLIAILPDERAEYEKSLVGDQARAEFNQLMASALCARVVPTAPGQTAAQARAKAGAIIADHSQILFSVFSKHELDDGEPGTHLVKWFDRGFSPAPCSLYQDALSPLDPPEPGRRIWIDANTFKPKPIEAPFRPALPKLEGSESQIDVVLKYTDKYNRDIGKNQEAIGTSYPLAPKDIADSGPVCFTTRAYHAADGLSTLYATMSRRSDVIVYILALIAFVAFNFIHDHPLFSWLYLVVTLAMLAVAGRIYWFSIDNRFLEYRSLAEAMRVKFFWRLAGVTRPVWLAYLSRHSGVVHWIRHSVRSLEFCQDCASPAVTPSDPQGLDAVRKHWISDQIGWFEKTEQRLYSRYRRLIWTSRVAIILMFVIAFGLAWCGYVYLTDPTHATSQLDWLDHVLGGWGGFLQIALGILGATAVAARGFLVRRADFELTKQYNSQAQIFKIARQMLDDLPKDPNPEWRADQIIEKLGQEALEEQAEWLWLRHSRPFEVPKN